MATDSASNEVLQLNCPDVNVWEKTIDIRNPTESIGCSHNHFSSRQQHLIYIVCVSVSLHFISKIKVEKDIVYL